MRGAGGGVQGFFVYFLWFFLGIVYGFLGLDCREPVTVSQKGLICVFCVFFMVFWAWVVEKLHK